MTLVWCFFLGSPFVQTFPLSLTDPLRWDSHDSSFELQSWYLVTWQVGGELRVKSSVLHPTVVPRPQASPRWSDLPWSDGSWEMPCAAFPETRTGLRATETGVGRCRDGCRLVSSSLRQLPLESQKCRFPGPIPGFSTGVRYLSILQYAFHVFLMVTTTWEPRLQKVCSDWHFSNHVP